MQPRLLPLLLLAAGCTGLWAAGVSPSPTPVSLLSGFLGAGKTTCLSHLLSNKQGLRVGVIVNDVAKLNIDADLVSQTEGDGVVRLQNGCACCDIAGELTDSLRTLGSSGEYDHILVELSGVAEPDVAKSNLRLALAKDPELGARLSRVVTLVDSSTFLSYFDTKERLGNVESLREEHTHADGEDNHAACADAKAVSQLLINQVDAADVLVVNKLDLVSDDEQGLIENMLGALNPKARLAAAKFGVLPSELVMPASSGAGADAEAEEEDTTNRRLARPNHFGINSFVCTLLLPACASALARCRQWPYTLHDVHHRAAMCVCNHPGRLGASPL